MRFKFLFVILFVVVNLSMVAQKFSTPFEGFGKRNTTFLTMADGTEYTVFVKGYKRKQGLIDEMKVVIVNGGKKMKIRAEDISHMYIAPLELPELNQK